MSPKQLNIPVWAWRATVIALLSVVGFLARDFYTQFQDVKDEITDIRIDMQTIKTELHLRGLDLPQNFGRAHTQFKRDLLQVNPDSVGRLNADGH